VNTGTPWLPPRRFLGALGALGAPWALALAASARLTAGLDVVVALAASLGVSAVVHELGHALGYWALVERGAALGLRRGFGLALGVRTPRRDCERAVASAGPGLAAGLGLLVLVVDRFSLQSAQLLALGLVLTGHVFGLLPGNDDGDRVWQVG
jgi:hypothetical protein